MERTGEEGVEVIELEEKEKRPSRWASKVFWSREHRGGLFTAERDGPKLNEN